MSTIDLTSVIPWFTGLALVMLFYISWRHDRREDRELKLQEQLDLKHLREKEIEANMHAQSLEAKRLAMQAEEDSLARYSKNKQEEEARIREKAGAESGGFIVIDLSENQRGLFHDLLKGFEEYAKLKGYSVAFSIDNTFIGKVAFKFTLTDADVIVVNDRVRKDLKEYMDKISAGDSLDDMPQIISLEEHEILVEALKNRIIFLHQNYSLVKTSSDFYESIFRKLNAQPILPAPNVYVQTGGHHSAPNYIANNSPLATLGNDNLIENRVRIAVTYRERKEQISKISEVIERFKNETKSQESDDAIRNLANIKEELELEESPDSGRLAKWLEKVKQAAQLGSFAQETVGAVKELIKLFGGE